MKKTFIPSVSLSLFGILCGLFVPVLFVGIYANAVDLLSQISSFFKGISFFNIFMIFTSILLIIVCGVAITLFLYSFVEFCLFAGRPLKFSGDMICQGYLKRKKYYKKDITGIGIAPRMWGSLYNSDAAKAMKIQESKAQGIYIAFGNYRSSDPGEYGIMNVWEAIEFSRFCSGGVNLNNKVHTKIGLPDCSKIQPFDGLLWLQYTEENMRFMKEWLGGRFEEVTRL